LNFEPKRGWESYVAASFIPSRIRNMLKAGIDYQIFFCLEDFKDNKQGVNQNVGLFWFEPQYAKYTGGPKSMFNVIRMLNMLGNEMFQASLLDNKFVGIIATKTKTGFALLLFYYINPEIAKDYLSRNITELHPKLAKSLANLINSNEWDKLLSKETSLKSLRLNKKIKAKIQEAIALNEKAKSLINQPRNINLYLTKFQENYTYKKYIVDKSCRLDCAFKPCEEKEIEEVATYQETLALEPYSVVLIVLDKKSSVPEELEKDKEEVPPVESEEKEIKQLEEKQIEEVIEVINESKEKGVEQ